MPAYLIPPGAWLSGLDRSALAATTPIDPNHHTAATTPIDPGKRHSADTPIDPSKRHSADTPIDPSRRAWPQPLQSRVPLPWDGLDPPWVYDDDAALLAQALRKSRAKIVRPGDDPFGDAALRRAARQGEPVAGSHLWRWGPQYRHDAVAAELSGRFQVHKDGSTATLWHLERVSGARKPKRVTATPMFEIDIEASGHDRNEQIDKVLRAAAEREDRMPEILSQAVDFWPFFESLLGVRLAALPRLGELLVVAQTVATGLLMAIKDALAERRPVQMSSLVMPLIATPAHGSAPSGHATLSTLLSELLTTLHRSALGPSTLLDQRQQMLDRLARRIAFNRVVAGVHFPIDNVAGYALGQQVARLLERLADDDHPVPAPIGAAEVWGFGRKSFTLDERDPRHVPASAPGDAPMPVAPQWSQLWQAAVLELRRAAL